MVLLSKNVKLKTPKVVKNGELLYILNANLDILTGYVVYVLLNVPLILEMTDYIVLNLPLMEEELDILFGMKINVIEKIKMLEVVKNGELFGTLNVKKDSIMLHVVYVPLTVLKVGKT